MKTIIFTTKYLGHCGCGSDEDIEVVTELLEDQTLDDLEESIIYKGLNWDEPHLYNFCFDNRSYSNNLETTYFCEGDEIDRLSPVTNHSKYCKCDLCQVCKSMPKPKMTDTKLTDIKMRKGTRFLLVFDFGDDHHFSIKVTGFGETDVSKKYPIVKTNGIIIPQYPEDLE